MILVDTSGVRPWLTKETQTNKPNFTDTFSRHIGPVMQKADAVKHVPFFYPLFIHVHVEALQLSQR